MKRVLWVGLLLLFALLLVSCDGREGKRAQCILGIHDFGQREDYDAEKNDTFLCEKKIYVRSCSLCGKKKYERGTAADHCIVEENNAPTCIEKGEKLVYCERCVLREESVYDALGHDISQTYFYDESRHWHGCSRCAQTADLDYHTFDGEGRCRVCAAPITTDGVIYTLSEDRTYAVVQRYLGDDGDVVISEEYKGVPVTAIGADAFYQKKITSVTIPDSVESIGKGAFFSCRQLTCVRMGNGVQRIGDYAFCACSALFDIRFSESLQQIGEMAFSSCNSLSELILPDGVEAIGDMAFQSCTGLVRAILPDSVRTLGYAAFANCKNMISVTLGDGMEAVALKTFFDCSKLVTVTVGSSLGRIESQAFYNCPKLTFIYYEGDSFPEMQIADGNEDFTEAMIVIPT